MCFFFVLCNLITWHFISIHLECILAYAVRNGSNYIFFLMAIQLSQYCFLNSPSFPHDLKCFTYCIKLYVLTIFIYYKFHTWVNLFLDFFPFYSIVIANIKMFYLIMEPLLYILISDMPRPSSLLFFFMVVLVILACLFFQMNFISNLSILNGKKKH